MSATFRFPLYALKEADGAGALFRQREGERRLLLFTSAENASDYRNRESAGRTMIRLAAPEDLRNLLAAHAVDPEFKIEIDPQNLRGESGNINGPSS
jgi:hypothetical protein